MTYFVKCYLMEENISVVVDDYPAREDAENGMDYYESHDRNHDHWYYIDDKEED